MIKLCFDYGHGGKDPGAIYKGRKEKDDVLYIGRRVASEMIRHGVIVVETRTRDMDLSLKGRTDIERKGDYDFFISFHRNAFSPEKAKGVEVFVYNRPSKKAIELANRVQKSLVGIGFVNRGVKRANFYVLRNTKAPALLLEIGFVDNTGDNKLYDNNREKIIYEISKAILLQLGITYK